MKRESILVSLLLAAAALGQASSGPGICFAFNDTQGTPGASLPLVTGGEIFLGFTAPATTSIERIDVSIGFALSATMTVGVYDAVGLVLGTQIGAGTSIGVSAGWVPLWMFNPVQVTAGSQYAVRLAISAGSLLLNGDATLPAPMTYLLNCGPTPPVIFPPCTSYPVVGSFAARLRFRAPACGPTPLATATIIGSGCGGTPAATLGNALPPILGTSFPFTVASFLGGVQVDVYLAFGPATAGVDLGIGGGCTAYIDLVSAQALGATGFNPISSFPVSGIQSTGSVPIPLDPSIAGAVVTTQAVILGGFGIPSSIGNIQITNALELTLGY